MSIHDRLAIGNAVREYYAAHQKLPRKRLDIQSYLPANLADSLWTLSLKKKPSIMPGIGVDATYAIHYGTRTAYAQVLVSPKEQWHSSTVRPTVLRQ